ncbi:hypothetical protein H5410_047250 [Solanum commersonii]|uniref:Uncharacterized protein n=1 Tax=Solanum commersonii TaxID=4109 RepID=A0A9J5XIL5_SOLCO|nr:hypothetical protein H5410_047250 [Solanum commersonii]
MSTKTKRRRQELEKSCKRNELIEHLKTEDISRGGCSPNVERAFSGVNGEEREGEFALNINRCTDGVDLERGFSDDSGDFGVGRSSLMIRIFLVLKETPST